MIELTAALAIFVGTHLAMSHPLRAPMVARLGANGFMVVYAVVSLATLAWAANAFKRAPVGVPLWVAGDGLWAVASAIMLAGAVLFVGSLLGNPALPDPRAAALAEAKPRGVFAITRHPMMWGFALWSLCHVLVAPRPAVVALTVAIALLALVGSAGQDAKKARLMGAAWQGWVARTAFVPFAGQLSRRIGWGEAIPRPHALAGGALIWIVASWAHPLLGGPVAGIWRWVAP